MAMPLPPDPVRHSRAGTRLAEAGLPRAVALCWGRSDAEAPQL